MEKRQPLRWLMVMLALMLTVVIDHCLLPAARTDTFFDHVEHTSIKRQSARGSVWYDAGPSYVHLVQGRPVKTWSGGWYQPLPAGTAIQVYRSRLFNTALLLKFEDSRGLMRLNENPWRRQPVLPGSALVFMVMVGLHLYFRRKPGKQRARLASFIIACMSFALTLIFLFFER